MQIVRSRVYVNVLQPCSLCFVCCEAADMSKKPSCLLCGLSKETEITGALKTKDQVTAHQNCLLYSSGIYCQNSPVFDDLFGFTVEDVISEVKRGKKLYCKKCGKRGATAGCEEKRCRKSYHYPCAVKDGAEIIEDLDNGKYGLYCSQHHQQRNNNSSVNGLASSPAEPTTSQDSARAGPSKEHCLTCEKTEGIISLESLSNSIFMFYCDNRAPSSYKRNDESAASRSPIYSSDSNSSSSETRAPSKKRQRVRDEEETRPHKRISGRISDSSSNSGSDLAESADQEQRSIREETESPTGSNSGNQPEGRDGNEDETITLSDAESDSQLLSVETCKNPQSHSTAAGCSPQQRPAHAPGQHTAGPSVPQQNCAGTSPSRDQSQPCSDTGSPPCTTIAILLDPPETASLSLISSSPSPVAHPSEPTIDSVSFWKSCTVAGCTQAIFADFIHEMNSIASRIQSEQATLEDYDVALKVIMASGKLSELVAKQDNELERKQSELRKAAAAMKEAVSELRK